MKEIKSILELYLDWDDKEYTNIIHYDKYNNLVLKL